LRDVARRADLAVECFEVGAVDRLPGGRAGADVRGARHQVRVVAPQVDRRDRAHGVLARDGPGQPVRGDADPHAALDDRQQGAARKAQWRKRRRVHGQAGAGTRKQWRCAPA
jgi:hypothetical protein